MRNTKTPVTTPRQKHTISSSSNSQFILGHSILYSLTLVTFSFGLPRFLTLITQRFLRRQLEISTEPSETTSRECQPLL